MTAHWRVVRQSTGEQVCGHWSERRAWRCCRRKERAEANGVWFDVRPVTADA